MKNERTSKRVARIAGTILKIKTRKIESEGLKFFGLTTDGQYFEFRWSDVRALAASALTQTPDKKPAAKKTKRARLK